VTEPIDSETGEILLKFYAKLESNIKTSERKLECDSVLFTLMKITSNKASKLLNESSITSRVFDKERIRLLESRDFIRAADDKDKYDEYVLTCQGIWEVEKEKLGADENTILRFIQKKYLSFSVKQKPLSEIERVIILSMIGTRVFSSETPMDLSDPNVRDHWLQIFRDCSVFLMKYKRGSTKTLVLEKQGNEHPIAYAMRHANDLPIKTKQIFVFGSGKRYYLDISEGGKPSKAKIEHLLRLVFGELDRLNQIEEIRAFCESIANEKGKFVRDTFEFIDHDTDSLIHDSLRQFYAG
jgi:hypothetical protein